MSQSTIEKAQGSGLFMWTAEHLEAATAQLKGQWIGLETTDNERLTATRIITDTRKIEAGDIYLAIVGEKFDGHSFVENCRREGRYCCYCQSACCRFRRTPITSRRHTFGFWSNCRLSSSTAS